MYPFIASKLGDEGKRLVDRSLQEHQGVKNILYELDNMKIEDAGFDQKMQMVMKELQQHIAGNKQTTTHKNIHT